MIRHKVSSFSQMQVLFLMNLKGCDIDHRTAYEKDYKCDKPDCFCKDEKYMEEHVLPNGERLADT